MRSRNAALTVLFCLLLAGLLMAAQQPPPAPPAPAAPQPQGQAPQGEQPKDVTIVLNQNGQPRKIKLAFPAFRGQLSGGAAAAGRELEETVRRDLETSGYFEIQGPDRLSGLALTGNVQQDLRGLPLDRQPDSAAGRPAGGGGPARLRGACARPGERPGGARQALPGAVQRQPADRPYLRRRGHPLPDRPARNRAFLDRLHVRPHG